MSFNVFYFQCHEADADVRLHPLLAEVDHRPDFQRSLRNTECPLHVPELLAVVVDLVGRKVCVGPIALRPSQTLSSSILSSSMRTETLELMLRNLLYPRLLMSALVKVPFAYHFLRRSTPSFLSYSFFLAQSSE